MSIALRENWGVSHKVHRLAIDTELCYSFYLYESATVNLIISLAILQPTLTQSHDQLPASPQLETKDRKLQTKPGQTLDARTWWLKKLHCDNDFVGGEEAENGNTRDDTARFLRAIETSVTNHTIIDQEQ
jgi:hypothetical protein